MSELNLSHWGRLAIGLLFSITGGIAFVLAFPPFEIWPLALVGFVPVLVAQYRIMPPKISSLAPAVGVAIWLQGYLGPVFAPVGTYMVWLPLIVFFISLVIDRGDRTFHAKTGYRACRPPCVQPISPARKELKRLYPGSFQTCSQL